jgi:hypothetical protein
MDADATELVEEVLANKRIFLRTILSRMRQSGNTITFKDEDDAEDIFSESLLILYERYILKGLSTDFISARRLMMTITRYRWYAFVRKDSMEHWLAQMTEEERDSLRFNEAVNMLATHPNAVYRRKQYAERTPQINAERRKKWQENEEYRAKNLESSHRYWERLKADPVRYAAYLEKDRERCRVRRLKRKVEIC